MPAAARSKLCGSVSAWLGVFASIAMSSAFLASVIVFTGRLLLLFFVRSKPFTLILSIDRKSDLTDKMKRSFFQAAFVSILLYGCITWTLTKRLEKKLDGNYTSMLRAILYKSTRHQLYGHLPPITKIIQVRRTRHAGHCWRSRDELMSDVLLWTPTYGRAKEGRPARTSFSSYVRTRDARGDER